MTTVYRASGVEGEEDVCLALGTSHPDRPSGRGALLSIQALRGCAAVSVAAYHALQWANGGFDVGRAGVDVFFIISGVVMWTSTVGRAVDPRAFLWRRFTRVAPVYWLTTLIVLGVALIWPAFLPEVRPGWGHLALSLAFVPHLDPRGLPFPTLPPGWSLDYEAVFYLTFALALAGPRAWRGRVTVGVLTAVTAFGFLAPNSLYTLGANPMLLQFAAGIGLGLAVEYRRLPGAALSAVLILAAVAIWAVEARLGLFTELWRPLLWGVPAVLLVAGGLGLEQAGAVPVSTGLSARAIKRLGDASYAIYLLHLPATALIAHTLGFARPWLFLVVALTVSVAAGLVGHALVERPLLSFLRRRVRLEATAI